MLRAKEKKEFSAHQLAPKRLKVNPLATLLETKEDLVQITSTARENASASVSRKREDTPITAIVAKKTSGSAKMHLEGAKASTAPEKLSDQAATKDEKRKAYFSKGSDVAASFEKSEKEHSEEHPMKGKLIV